MKGSRTSHHLPMAWNLAALVCLCLSACHLGLMDQFFAPRQRGEFQYDCSPMPDEPEGYVVKVCEVLNEKQKWVGRNSGLAVAEVMEREIDGTTVIVRLFPCCGTGDTAAIDKETGEVLGYNMEAY